MDVGGRIMRSTRTSSRVVLVAALMVLCSYELGGAAVQVARGDDGLTVSATGARLEEVLATLADAEGFAVAIQEGIERSPVDVEVHDATVEEALRAVLRGNNYVIGYETTAEGLAVSRVEVLLPRPAEQSNPNSNPNTQMQRAHAAMLAAQQRQQAQRTREAQQRLEQARVARQRRQATLQAQRQVQQRQQVAAEPVPLRRMLWGRSP
jgi:hypothetical protein